MRNRLILPGMLFGVLILTAASHAQWQPDSRLTNDPDLSSTSYNNAWCIAASGDTVHVVWYDGRDGNFEIYYKRSTDGGSSWGADTWLTTNLASSRDPSVSVSGSLVHVVWSDTRDGNDEIYHKRSTDGGTSWGVDTRLTIDPLTSENPSASASGSVVHVVWEDRRHGNWEIYYKRSTDGGTGWGPDTRLTNNTAQSSLPSVATSGPVVHVVWYDFRDTSFEIYYKRSPDGGVSWGSDVRLTYNVFDSYWPCVAVSGSEVHVVWYDFRDLNSEIYYKHSSDGGLSWGADNRLTNQQGSSWIVSVVVSGSVVNAVWSDDRDGNFEIYHKRSTDGGSSWGADTRLTNNAAVSTNPSGASSGSVVHVVWQDHRDGNWEIYYKRNPTGNPTDVTPQQELMPQDFRLLQSYPNPFNPRTKIVYRVRSREFIELRVYDVLGREVATLVNEVKEPGSYEVTWDASGMGPNSSGLASGVYFYRLQAGDFVSTKKLVLLR